jgi:hypothetical protein
MNYAGNKFEKTAPEPKLKSGSGKQASALAECYGHFESTDKPFQNSCRDLRRFGL